MFHDEFFPTPRKVIEAITTGMQIEGKVFLEPSGGKGDIVDYLTDAGAKNVIACEIDENLRKILATKCRILENDFLALTSDKVSHIDAIVMNPPFSTGTKHFLHAFEIAPNGCEIVCLLNASNLQNTHTAERKQLKTVVENYGQWFNIGDCFADAERKTGVEVAFIKVKKPGESSKNEFEGFFMEEEPQEEGVNGIMSYNVVRDLVNRYIGACKIYEEILTVKGRLNEMTGSFFNGNVGVQLSYEYDEYKKELQKSGWAYIFNKMNLTKYATKGLKEDINKFVEQQKSVPFTMKNIYKMLEIVIATTSQRMDKAILEAFDRVTERHNDNRYNVKGWKTNLHYLVGRKFILPYQIRPAKEYGINNNTYRGLNDSFEGTIADLEKALCYITGDQYEEYKCVDNSIYEYTGILTLRRSINNNWYGEWYESHFFRYKGYKNGNMHFEFKDEKVWNQFNQIVAKLKGYPLYESKEQTAYQKRNANNKAA